MKNEDAGKILMQTIGRAFAEAILSYAESRANNAFDEMAARFAVLYTCQIFDQWRTKNDEKEIKKEIENIESNAKFSRKDTGNSRTRSTSSCVSLAFYDGFMFAKKRESDKQNNEEAFVGEAVKPTRPDATWHHIENRGKGKARCMY